MLKRLSEINPNELDLYGGKAISLSKLMNTNGINVPNGFVVSWKIDDIQEQQDAILDLFDELDSNFVAVRSSANIEDGKESSFAGQFETFLNVDKTDLIDKIIEARSFVDSPKVKKYCEFKSIPHEEIKLSIIIQSMLPSDVSGVCFTKNPVNGNDEIIVEACFGLGEALVSGKVTPDYYRINNKKIDKNIRKQKSKLVFDKKTKTNKYHNIPKSKQKTQKLDDSKLLKLSRLAKKIEKEYKVPVDIEWSLTSGKLYLLQTRPITTFGNSEVSNDEFDLDSDKYIHLWDWGAPYIISKMDFESFSDDKRNDFISYSELGQVSLFVSKETQNKLSETNFKYYYDQYEKYVASVEDTMQEIKSLVDKITQDKLIKLSNSELANLFDKYFNYVYKMNKHYSVTESFSTQKVEKVLVEKDMQYDLEKLKNNVNEMGEFKLKQRELCNKLWDYKKGYLSFFLNEIENRLKVKNLENYHYSEISKMLRGEKIETEDRSIWINGQFTGWKDIHGDPGKYFYSTLVYIDIETDIIEGTVSNKGQYVGKVRKIDFDIATDYESEIKKMQKGEILVSGSTGPELIMACKKAGAIITDEGGVISHAAIISRELGIPCITDTKLATKVLNTGDLIQVDAINGKVKLLKE